MPGFEIEAKSAGFESGNYAIIKVGGIQQTLEGPKGNRGVNMVAIRISD